MSFNVVSMMVLYFSNNNPLYETFVELFLPSIFLLGLLHGANFLVCLVIFYCELLILHGNFLGNIFIAYYEDAFIQTEFAVPSTQLPKASASPRPL